MSDEERASGRASRLTAKHAIVAPRLTVAKQIAATVCARRLRAHAEKTSNYRRREKALLTILHHGDICAVDLTPSQFLADRVGYDPNGLR
jgi:hypothetical protein